MTTFGFFYYSKKQEQLDRNLGMNHKNYARQIFTGKVVRYNQWVSKFPFLLSKHNWGDYKLVAIGWFERHEHDPNDFRIYTA